MGSRVRIAAAACLVASGLFVGGVGGALAFAEPPLEPVDNGGAPHNDSPGDGRGTPKTDDERTHPRPGESKPGEGKPGDGETGETDDGRPGEGESGETGEGETGETGEGETGETGEGTPGEGETGEGEPTTTEEPEPTKTTDVPPPEEPEEPGNCEEEGGDDDCEPGWPWWPWPWPWQPGEPPGQGGGGGGAVEPPSGRPEAPPAMQVPPHVGVEPSEPPVISVEPGLGVAAAELPLAPITLPIIVTPPAGLGGGSGAPPSAPAQTLPGAPRVVPAEPPAGRQSPPASVDSNVAAPASSYRIGYTEYLRSAGMPQVVALAVPGVAGMLVLTGAGGLVGYRQAKAGHALRTGGIARFVN